MFAGYAQLDVEFDLLFVITNSSGVPVNSSATPGYRIYDAGALMTNGTGSATQPESGSITGATNASPIVITSAAHGLSTGQQVTVASVGGNTAANGTFLVTVVDANSFSLDGSTGNGSYTSGGTWKTTGLYKISFTPTTSDGFASGGCYTVLVNGTVSSTGWCKEFRFAVL